MRMLHTGFFVPKDILTHTDARITQSALDYWRADGYGLVVSLQEDERTLAVSAVAYERGVWVHAITITHRDYRRMGLGSQVLALRLSLQANIHPEASRDATVADDNAASVALCQGQYDIVRATKTATRRSGQFTQLVFTKGN